MQRNRTGSPSETYSEEVDIHNTVKMREILEDLPRFCRMFFRGIAETTGSRTRLAYAYDLRLFFEYMHDHNSELSKINIRDFQIQVLDQIGKEDIEEFLEYVTYYEKDGKVYTNDELGKSRKLSAIRSMYHYFFNSELIDRDVAALIPMPKRHEKAIIRLEPNEVAKLLDQVEDGTGLTKSQLRFHEKTKVRDTALLTLLLGTGIRVSECVGLDLNDVNFDDGGIKVHRKGGYDAIVYFGEEVEAALRAYLSQRKNITAAEGSENALFLSLQNKRITVRAVEKLVKKYAQTVTTLKKITPHKLRSTYGTSLYRETGDIYLVADVLGHKDVNTTRRHYAAIEEDRRRKAANIVKLREDENNGTV
ncbi:MAG TPA: integrase [Lachnospiraceae bacterium]|nr:tyrosine-type recombinase/integrase [Lachnospiraceae bacterium]HAP73618.1 integrase [Lachnospiraceae bacterium]